jgi:hypothetical protein
MSANAPTDDAWATLLTQVAELQAKIATLESQMKVAQEEIVSLDQEFTEQTTDPLLFAVIRYIADRDDVAESKVC